MKRFLILLFLSCFVLIPKSFSKNYGEGQLFLNDNMIKYFHQYLIGKGNQKPMIFTIAIDGSYATYWYCSASQCTGSNPVQFIKACERDAGIECKIFAKGRYIKWKNGINKGKGKESKINSRQSFSELKARLGELGFVDNGVSKTQTSNSIDNSESKKEPVKTAVSVKEGDLNGFMNALEKAKNAGLTIDADTTAKQFGYKNFEEFFNHYKSQFEIGDLSIEDAKEFLLGADNTVEIVESQENLDKLHNLIINDKYFRKRTGYFKKKYKDKVKLLVVYMNYEKEMSKITKDPNLKKIGKFDFRFRFGGSASGMKPYALEDCEKSRKNINYLVVSALLLKVGLVITSKIF